jgi:hypothetical protein
MERKDNRDHFAILFDGATKEPLLGFLTIAAIVLGVIGGFVGTIWLVVQIVKWSW